VNTLFKLTLLSATLSLGACTVLEGEKIDYKSTAKAPSLAVPPDLTQLSRDSRYTVVDGAVSAAGSQKSTAGEGANAKSTVAALGLGDVRIERAGNQRWLVINRPAEALWEPIKDFWQENGFLLAMDQKNLGIMETDWAENRAKIPQDFIRNSLGKILDSLYSTSERDKFRTRIERNANGSTEVFISHRGVMETYTSESKNQTVWQPRAADPELEAEFLRRLMQKLGATKEATAKVASAVAAKATATSSTLNGQPVVILEEGFERAWRRVGLALDRTGFTVEDRDRNKGVYFVRYVPTDADKSEPGFFKKIFGGSAKATPAEKFQIVVTSAADKSTVSVLNAAGAPETSDAAKNIVKVIAEDIK
jgi:outer membrane protein assembly factor BamC